MKHAETESFIKSFLVFFISLALLSGLVVYYEYTKKRQAIELSVFNEMKLCSFDLKCTQFTFDFIPLHTNNLYQLQQDEQGLYALFSVPGSDQYALKLHYAKRHYDVLLDQTKTTMIKTYLIILTSLAVLSTLFSLYALYPLRKALRLTQEFSRDILHDLNTPLSSLRLNVSRLNLPQSETKKLQRIEQSIQTIVSLGDNLRGYLEGHVLQSSPLELHALVQERLAIIQRLYPHISFSINDSKLKILVNHDAITRIIDNLLNNAAKYNTDQGSVSVDIDPNAAKLHIQDTGKGIQYPEKIFDRFYKEHERGLGIGLHIVKKLCDELAIIIHVQSTVNQGSLFTLDLKALTIR
ncbi:MAG TPA: HAMP domain-containing sensor histidine kinase [Sulfuricurvum sp.]|nr:HAMP domain-containing sensor histidine kinase [Sulfuricurvum sp.]